MKFKLNEHPSIMLFLISLLVLTISIVIAALYNWVFYADIAIGLAVIASGVLAYSMFIDLKAFNDKRNKYYDENPEAEKQDAMDEKKEKDAFDDDWNKD